MNLGCFRISSLQNVSAVVFRINLNYFLKLYCSKLNIHELYSCIYFSWKDYVDLFASKSLNSCGDILVPNGRLRKGNRRSVQILWQMKSTYVLKVQKVKLTY